jgi:methionyl-tRNA synthetase
MSLYITTTIPYVNARPHLGHALEFVQADVLARHRRQRGEAVRFLTGTDDNALKNVKAARAEGLPTAELVARNAAWFAALREPLELSFDDFIRTSADPRHRAGVERLWRACATAGDIYERSYEGLYCVGCEQFLTPAELVDGHCPEHLVAPEPVAERNWFFRLSRYADRLAALIDDGELRIVPDPRRNEIRALIAAGLEDFSISRSAERAHGWGIEVPGDPSQIVYVWWDALGNYVTALDYGGGGDAYRRWWVEAAERVHVLGKGVIRFHALYWPALLLSAGEPLPTTLFVHDYLTVKGRKISKSLGNTVEPAGLVARFGTDAVRWWLLREPPRVGETDFTVDRLVTRHDTELANELGNLVHRTVSLVWRLRDGRVPESCAQTPLDAVCRGVGERVSAALANFDFRGALDAIWSIVTQGNRYVEATRPWELADASRSGKREDADVVLAGLVRACRDLAGHLAPFLPSASARLGAQLGAGAGRDGGHVPRPSWVFPRLSDERGRQRGGHRLRASPGLSSSG